jgi:hypothetical protein
MFRRMGVTAVETGVAEAVVGLGAALDRLTGLALYSLSQDELVVLVGQFEVFRRRLPVVDHVLVGELEARSVADMLGARNTQALLRELLRLSPAEANGRVQAAHRLGPRETVSGEVLPPQYPQVAAAQGDGVVSGEQARVITATIEDLPASVRAEHGEQVERTLVAAAARFDPTTLGKLGRHLQAVLDPDGILATEEDQQRRRTATLTPNRDGSGDLRAHLTPETLAKVQATLLPLAAPRPCGDTRDDRTAPQRLHDALDTAAAMLLRSGQLPASGGTPATVLLTMTLDQLEQRAGLVTTGHGGQLTVDQALRLAGEADVIPTVIGTDGILGYGRSRRIASASQRRALAARDGGCVFPGCDHPPDWTEAHHITPWNQGGKTDLDNLCLLCDHHHDHHRRAGWRIVMQHGRPWAIPPPWIDPTQPPTRNTMHDTTLDPVPAA